MAWTVLSGFAVCIISEVIDVIPVREKTDVITA